jgi:predicted GIY-YIG superfamily endonuclease
VNGGGKRGYEEFPKAIQRETWLNGKDKLWKLALTEKASYRWKTVRSFLESSPFATPSHSS